MRIVVTLLLVLIAAPGCQRQDAAAAAQPSRTVDLTLAAYNVENYFDQFNDRYTDDETTEPKDPAELAELAKAIRALDADFLGVSEMENEGELYRFVHEHLSDMEYKHVYVGHRDWGRGINNGGFSRVPVGGVTTHRFWPLTLPGEDRQWSFARDVIEFDLRPAEGVSVSVFTVHFKSKRDSRGDPASAKWRLAEALALKRIIEGRLGANPRALIAVIGDMNDTPDSPPLRALTAGDRPLLIDTMARVPAEKKITYLREPYRSTIDYILVSPALARQLVPGSAGVGTQHLGGSDHGPVMATFRLHVAGDR